MRYLDLTYSEIFYLFADQLVPISGIYSNSWNDIPISVNEVPQKELAKMLCICALVYLLDKNVIKLEIIELENTISFFKTKLIIKKKVVIVEKTSEYNPYLCSIEKKFYEKLTRKKRVSDIVKSLIPDGVNDPSDVVISIVREDLIQKRYLSEEKGQRIFISWNRYIVNQEEKTKLEKKVEQIKQSLSVFKSYKDLYEKTSHEIEDAISSKEPIPGC